MGKIPLALYLWRRIHEVGIRSIMGVPGDFNLDFLDYIFDVSGLKWIGNSNELNAAYAADGYARVKRVPGCLVTTHGVGELSAMNGIAGAASEHIPVIHIVGQTPMFAQEKHLMIHHSIGTYPDHQQYNKTSKHLRHSAAELQDGLGQAPAAIDKAIRDCFISHQPVYIFFPIDMTAQQVDESLLNTKIDIFPTVDTAIEDEVVTEIQNALYAAKKPSLFIDYLAHSYGQPESQALVEKLDLPHFSSHMGKGCVDEDHSKFVGVYNASVSTPGVADAFEACDLVISVGWFSTDSNSAYFSRNMPKEKRIDIQPDYVSIKGKRYNGLAMASLLTRLTKSIDASRLPKLDPPKAGQLPTAPDHDSKAITQSWIWPRLGSFLRPGDVILADTGTAAFGVPDTKFPKNVKYICQTYYGSIGYATPSSLGCDIALQELHEANSSRPRGRTILVTGDGSLMLTMQEISVMVLRKVPVLVVIINNAGYTIERAIHGARQPYNDIPRMSYSKLLPLFSSPSTDNSNTYRKATTKAELETALTEDAVVNVSAGEGPQVLEVEMDAFDVPWRLSYLLEKRKPGYLKREGFTNAK